MKDQKLTNVIEATRFNKISLNEIECSKVCTILKENLQVKNATSVYCFVNLFNLSSLQISTLNYIERFFTIVSDNESFLELEYNFISIILASSELLITSEIEVFKVANRWLNHNIEERSKYAEDLYLKCRLHLLSTETIKHLFKDSTFTKVYGCVKTLNKMLDCRVNSFYRFSSTYHTSRYCSNNHFKLMVLGGHNDKTSTACSNFSCIDVKKLGNVEAYPPMKMGFFSHRVVYLKGDIYVFGGCTSIYKKEWIKSVDKYSLIFKTWSQVAEMNNYLQYFCVCAFVDKIFVAGGYTEGQTFNSCLQFNTNDYSWKIVASMKEPRSSAACAVFEERIVVSGGLINDCDELNSVELFDVLPNK